MEKNQISLSTKFQLTSNMHWCSVGVKGIKGQPVIDGPCDASLSRNLHPTPSRVASFMGRTQGRKSWKWGASGPSSSSFTAPTFRLRVGRRPRLSDPFLRHRKSENADRGNRINKLDYNVFWCGYISFILEIRSEWTGTLHEILADTLFPIEVDLERLISIYNFRSMKGKR